MRSVLSIIIVFCSFLVFGCSSSKAYLIPPNGFDKQCPPNTVFQEEVNEELDFVVHKCVTADDKKLMEGPVHTYFNSTKTTKTKGLVQNGLMVGQWFELDKNGDFSVIINFDQDGLKHGWQIRWNDDEKFDLIQYNHGQPTTMLLTFGKKGGLLLITHPVTQEKVRVGLDVFLEEDLIKEINDMAVQAVAEELVKIQL